MSNRVITISREFGSGGMELYLRTLDLLESYFNTKDWKSISQSMWHVA